MPDGGARFQTSAVTLPSYSPESNPVKEGWQQLQTALDDRFFDSLDDRTPAIDRALDRLPHQE